jgi:recombination protein RecT
MMSEPQTVNSALEQQAPRMLDEARWADVLPAHIGPARFQRWALTLMQKPDMIEVARTPEGQLSIVTALLDCASLGLEPGRTYHLVKLGGTVTGITDYKGEIELINRADPAACVVAMLVRKADEFAMRGANVPPLHTADWFSDDRGEVTGGYAYVDYGGGRYSQVIRMSEQDFLRHRGKAKTKNVWDEWPEAMRLKTLIHQLRKWVRWSTEIEVRP